MAAVIRSFGRFIGLLAAASVVIFVLLRAVPGDPARVALGVNATDEAVAELSQRLGADRPLATQYADWVGALITGDFGVSMASGRDITDTVLERAGVSLTLTLSAMALALLVAVPLGVRLARRPSFALDALTQVGMAVPSFLVGILAVALFSVRLGWLPANGWGSPAHAVLPVASLALVQAAILTRYVRAAVAEEMEKDYVRTGRAQGASISDVLLLDRYVASNAAYTSARTGRIDDRAWVADLEFGRLGLPRPDLQVLVDTEPETARERATKREHLDASRTRDRYERDTALQDATFAAYSDMADTNWEGWWLRASDPQPIMQAIGALTRPPTS